MMARLISSSLQAPMPDSLSGEMLGATIGSGVPSPRKIRPLPLRPGGMGQPGLEKSRSEWHSKQIATDSTRYSPLVGEGAGAEVSGKSSGSATPKETIV